jgi:hypothetical protein
VRSPHVDVMRIAYAAHTEACTLYLDEDGICRRVVRLRRATLHGLGAAEDAAERCIGAQYVASLDFETRGGLAPSPEVGKPMLFAYVRDNGRIGLVRTGPLVRFDTRPAETMVEKPDSGVRQMPNDRESQITLDADPAYATQPLPAIPFSDDDIDDPSETEVRTHVFRSSRPPPVQTGIRPPPMRHDDSWTPPTPVHEIKVPPPAISSAPTLKDPPRGRGMLPARLARGRG